MDDLNLHIAPGEIYGFIGHNGAGKTTTLKSIAGIISMALGTGTVQSCGNTPRRLRSPLFTNGLTKKEDTS